MSEVAETQAKRPRGGESKPAPADSEALSRGLDRVLLAAFLSLTFLLGLFPLKDTDFWWHLRTGDRIRETGRVPVVDDLTFGAEGNPWIDLHWIFQVLLSFGHERGGVPALTYAKCVITCLAVLLLVSARKRDWPLWTMLLAWLPGLLVLSGRMYVRPETLTLLYLSAVLAILFRREENPRLLYVLPLIQVFWVNTQGLFVFGPIVIACALAEDALRPGAFAPARSHRRRTFATAAILTGLACLVNPYGLKGALYPLQLLSTMASPIFSMTIAELKPIPQFIEEAGWKNLPLLMHLATIALGGLSFIVPGCHRIIASLFRDKSDPALNAKKSKAKAAEPKKSKGRKRKKSMDGSESEPRISLFRLVLYIAFSALSLKATRNSHQFAAVVGCVTAWNFGEWGAELARGSKPSGFRVGPRLATLGILAAAFGLVAGGRFYAWAGEGRTIGVGEEPLWFPHEAVKLAGEPDMPSRSVCFHNGHAALYEYYHGPDRKVFADARLEVMGVDVYSRYLDLERRIAIDARGGADNAGWAEELDRMGRPLILVDTNPANPGSKLHGTLLTSSRYRCIYLDPKAALYIHAGDPAAASRAIDFGERHFRRVADRETPDEATLTAWSKTLWSIAYELRLRPSGDEQARRLIRLGLDYARRLRDLNPASFEGWKQIGNLEYLRDPPTSREPIARYLRGFDAVIDLSSMRATYALAESLKREPNDVKNLVTLAGLFQIRAMDEASLPLLERFLSIPPTNLAQRQGQADSRGPVAQMRAKLGPVPSTKWSSRAELDRLAGDLLAQGRVRTAAEVLESAYRPESRSWDYSDRLGVMWMHLGEPAKAREAWSAGEPPANRALRLARVAVSHLVEDDFPAARKAFLEAIEADPRLFEARYGLAVTESDAGDADAALEQARRAREVGPNESSRSAASSLEASVAPYVSRQVARD